MSTSGHSKDLKKNSKNTPFILSWRPKRYFWRRGRWRPQIFFTSLLLYIYLFQFHYLFNQFLSSVLVLGLLLFNVQERTFELNWCFCRQAQHRIFFYLVQTKMCKSSPYIYSLFQAGIFHAQADFMVSRFYYVFYLQRKIGFANNACIVLLTYFTTFINTKQQCLQQLYNQAYL